jgi:hypothetical protein
MHGGGGVGGAVSRWPAVRRCSRRPAPPCPAAAPPPPRCVSIFRDKNRRHIGKSQSKRPPKRTQRPPHHCTMAGAAAAAGSAPGAGTPGWRRRGGGRRGGQPSAPARDVAGWDPRVDEAQDGGGQLVDVARCSWRRLQPSGRPPPRLLLLLLLLLPATPGLDLPHGERVPRRCLAHPYAATTRLACPGVSILNFS